MPVSIRPCLPDDVGAVTAIYRAAVLGGTGSFEIDPPDRDEMAGRLARVTGQGYPYLVAGIDGAVAGYAYAFAYRDRPAYRFTVEDSVYVDPRHQGRGVGTALLRGLVSRCEELGFRQMVAVIGDGDNEASVRIHRRAGFDLAGTLPSVGWKFDRWLDVVLMRRPLGRGADVPPP